MKKSTKKGFTLVELVIVIAVIAILAAVLIPTFSNVVARANASADLQTLTTNLEGKFVEYVADAHKAPTGILVKENDDGATEFVDFVAAGYAAGDKQAVYTKVVLTGQNGYAFVVGLTGDGSYTVAHVTSTDTKHEPLTYKEAIVDAQVIEYNTTNVTVVTTDTTLTSYNTKTATVDLTQNYYFKGDVVSVTFTYKVNEGDASKTETLTYTLKETDITAKKVYLTVKYVAETTDVPAHYELAVVTA